jgi:abhydrolase domain-containing protein 14
MSDLTSRNITLGGARVHLLEAGPPSGGAVLFLHGARFRASTWEDLGTLALFGGEGFRVVAIDLPGFGDSEESSLTPAAFLPALLDELDLERPVVVSPSMSGGFSLPLVADHAERLAGFVAVAPVAIDEYSARLAGNPLPTLLVWGGEDTLIPFAEAELLATGMANARVEVIADAGHACYMQQPDRFHELLRAFLQETR